jgi:tetratricopeptide (TPR) repeat protein
MFLATTTLVDADIAKLQVRLSVSLSLPLNEMPMYGGKPKSVDQIKLDQDFISNAIKTTGSREAAFKAAIGSGFQYMQKFDWRTAMKRFNQAWLLMPDRAEVFWGFGAAISHQGKFEESLQYFTKADELDPRNARMLNDFGFMYQFWASVRSQYEADKISRLKKSIELFERAAAIDPANAHIQANWAGSLYYMQNYLEGTPVKNFDIPANLEVAEILPPENVYPFEDDSDILMNGGPQDGGGAEFFINDF